MKALGLTMATQVVVGADDTLVAEPDDGLLATVASHSRMFFSLAVAAALLVFAGVLVRQDVDGQLVDGALHFGESNDELIVGADGHLVPLIVGPGQLEILSTERRKNGDQLLPEVAQGAADVTIDDKASHLRL